MGYLKEIRLGGTTNASGVLTVDSARPVMGRLYAIVWEVGTFDAGVDVAFSTILHDALDTNLLTLTDANADGTYYPRALVHNNAGTALTGTAGGDRDLPLFVGVPRMAVTSGGNAKAGAAYLYYFED